jgi:hypothetical protein
MAKADGSYHKELAKIHKNVALLLEDFGLSSFDSEKRLIYFYIF